jgi:large subunit ribosomal protein L22
MEESLLERYQRHKARTPNLGKRYMEYIAEAKNVKMAPRKVRLVAEGVKKHQLPHALAMLFAMRQRAAVPVKKTIESAIANAVHNFKVDKNELVIEDILVNEGITYKRYHYAARGRTRPYKRRTSHIRVVLGVKPMKQPKMKLVKKDEVKTEKEESVEK